MSEDDARVEAEPQAGEPDAGEEPGEHRALIQALLRQTPEERLIGLRRAAAFFGSARRA